MIIYIKFAVACAAVFTNCLYRAGCTSALAVALAGSIFLEQTAQCAVFHGLIRGGGCESGVAVNGAVRYRTAFAAVNAAGSVSVTGFIPQISDIIRIRVVSKGMNLRIRDDHNRDRIQPIKRIPSAADTGSRSPFITGTIGIYDCVCNIDYPAGTFACCANSCCVIVVRICIYRDI